MQRIVIIGATSAIARSCARLWVAQGSSLFLVGRDKARLESLLADLRVRGAPDQCIESMNADLNDFDRHESLLGLADEAMGGIDVVLIAHGSLPDQRACEQSVDLTLREISTNALSVVSLLTLAANRLETQGFGVIAAISSVAGDRGRQSNYVYGAAKGMVSIFMQGLRNRLSKKGVAVVTIKPGFVDTPMTAHFEKKGVLWAQPEAIAKGIVLAVEQRRDVVYLFGIWRWIMLIIKHIPEAIFKRLSL
jgi:decaprenylphospho-beta-D-erythro-pentofuranosid-2-ulose 2-reductase